MPNLNGYHIVGFFQKPSQLGSCGCGFYIKFSFNDVVYGWIGGWLGTNIRAELLACWGLLTVATHKNITSLQVCGDSKIVLDWLQGHSTLQVSILSYQQQTLIKVKSSFNSSSFHHMYREYNSVAGSLSKMAVMAPFGKIKLVEILNGVVIHQDILYLM